MNKEEIWKSVENSNQKYQVSNKGRVKSFKQNKNGVIMSGTISTTGYHKYSIMISDKFTNIKTHRLVALHFIPNPDNLPIVDHINGDILDNTVENLRWVDFRQNCLNSAINKTNTSGCKGVSYHTLNERWIATCIVNGNRVQKSFTDIHEAIKCRKEWEILHYPPNFYSDGINRPTNIQNEIKQKIIINEEHEKWLYINNSDNMYSISNMGRLKSFRTYPNGKFLKGSLTTDGYIRHQLILNSKQTYINLHQMIATYFIPNPNSQLYTIVDHIDGNKLNNTVNNLRWVNRAYNNLNTKISCRNTSGYKGINYDGKRWVATWTQDGISKKQRFENKDDAIEYRNKMVATYYSSEHFIQNR
jgi:hypothetical protein